jgi:AraC family transcriptional activator FtrA
MACSVDGLDYRGPSVEPLGPAAPVAPVAPPAPHEVAVVVYDGVTAFELGVACDIFGSDWSADFGVAWYQLSICGASSGPITVDEGFSMLAPHGLDRVSQAGTVIVLPTEHLELVPPEIFEALRAAHAQGRRIVSFCTGAFVLAAAGLLDGRRATTHWSECAELARRYPRVAVDAGVLYIDDGDILTSAGSAASIDLCLHLVRGDYGTGIATQLARQLVVPPHRAGGQAQYIESPLPDFDSPNLFTDTVVWLEDHLDEALTIEDLAGRAAMSPRTFARRFAATTGTTPFQWLVARRVQLAQHLLEESDLPIEAVADRSGFCTAGNLRKHFSRAVQTSPQAYRRTFRDRRAG